MEIEWLPLGQSRSDKLRAAHYQWVGMPPGLTPELASKFMLGFHGGKTISDMIGQGDSYICSLVRFKKHCNRNPEWGAEARRLSKANSDTKKATTSHKANATQEYCLKGLHAMTPDNVLVWRSSGRRQCPACQAVTQANPPVHAVVASLDKIKADLSRGISIAEMMKRQKINTRPFYHFRTLNPDFDQFVREATQNKGARRNVRAVQVHISNVRQENNDYHANP